MLSKNDIKFIRSLGLGKYRLKSGKFIAEGNKIINELIHAGMVCDQIYTIAPELFQNSSIITSINEKELKQISFLTHPKDALAIFNMPRPIDVDLNLLKRDFSIVCDCIQDPGNLGTIIRIADWFGIKQIICSEDTVDFYNPKVVQSSMASVGRVTVHYKNLLNWLKDIPHEIPVLAADVHGESMYEITLPENGLIIFGNEAKGLRKEILEKTTHRLLIPGSGNAESLNVAVSAGIICAELRRPR